MKLLSWNVNGIRAAQKNGFESWLADQAGDIICLQETRARPDQIDEALVQPKGYHAQWFPAEMAGYSGVATFSKIEPLNVEKGLGIQEFDREGRVLITEFKDFHLLNAYFPNSQGEGARLDYKLAFCNAVLKRCQKLQKAGKNIVLCGDYNIAHKAIDLKNPKANEKNAGFLPEERAWMDTFTEKGFVDTFREFEKGPDHYTWWSYRFRARSKNIGWRIDYFCVNPEFRDRLQSVRHQTEVMGSDHCPVELHLR